MLENALKTEINQLIVVFIKYKVHAIAAFVLQHAHMYLSR